MEHAKRDGRFITAFLGTLTVVLALLSFSPYKSNAYVIPARSVYVDWYQDDSIWADLMHDISMLSDAVRRADALILGSSKPLYGISARMLNQRFEPYRLRFFNLGIGGGEGVKAAARIITTLDLRHKTLLINLDDNMLSEFVSENSSAALRMDRFKAATRVASVRATAIGDTLLDHAGLPQLRYEGDRYRLSPRNVARNYRDLETGDAVITTSFDSQPVGQHAFAPAPADTRFPAKELDSPHFTRALRDWTARGMHLVFFTIPYGIGSPSRNNYTPDLVRVAAEQYGGEYVDLDWRLAKSFDYIHVDRDSRTRLSESLADQLADPSRGFVERALAAKGEATGVN
jgi:hypothetical protein